MIKTQAQNDPDNSNPNRSQTCILETLYITNKLQMRHRKKNVQYIYHKLRTRKSQKKNNKGAESTYFELCF